MKGYRLKINSLPRNSSAEAGRFIMTWSTCSQGFKLNDADVFIRLFEAFLFLLQRESAAAPPIVWISALWKLARYKKLKN